MGAKRLPRVTSRRKCRFHIPFALPRTPDIELGNFEILEIDGFHDILGYFVLCRVRSVARNILYALLHFM
jgi:hypothetical protein